jgi:hypothetical protein
VFVDHDPTRLSDATDERWVVRDGGLVAGGGSDVGSPTPVVAAHRTAIEVDGVATEVSVSLASFLPEASLSTEPDGVHRIVVDAALSDSVLRRLLALVPEVHIVAVSQLPPQIRANEES